MKMLTSLYHTSHLVLLLISLVEGMLLQVQGYLALHLITFRYYKYQSLLYLLSVHLFDRLDMQLLTLLYFNCCCNNINLIGHRMFGLTSIVSLSYSHREIIVLVFYLTFSSSLLSIVLSIPLEL
jgi:hypothetical protein